MFDDLKFEGDGNLKLSHPNFGEELHTTDCDSNQAKSSLFPSDYILALFSELAYEDEFHTFPDNWKLLTDARNLNKYNKYFGVAFWNPLLCQVVVAHRGTKDLELGALINDIQLGLKKDFYTSQLRSAATFVASVASQINEHNKKIKEKTINGPIFQLSLTGHSLGAWLAQMTTFTVKYFKMKNNGFVEDAEYAKNIHPHTVVFESPGCRETLSKLVEEYVPIYIQRRFGNFDRLDMVVYLSKLNPINSINRHVGTVYQVVNANTHGIREIVNLFDHKTHKIEKKLVLYFKSGFRSAAKRIFINYIWPVKEDESILDDADDTECSLNVFNEDEFCFVIDYNYAIKHGSKRVLDFQQSHSIPKFTVNEEYNKLIGNDLNKTIACIRYLQPLKSTVMDLLKEDGHAEMFWNILNMEITHYYTCKILDFNEYFEDKYGLKDFLQSHDQQMLFIHVDTNSDIDYQLEANFVHNILKFYEETESLLLDSYFKTEEGKYCFISWNQLDKIKRYIINIVGKIKDKVNLIIVECFEEYKGDYNDVFELLERSGKVIIISADSFSWLEEKRAIQVDGFGKDLKYQDLREISQQEFRQQKYLRLYGKELSLDDILVDQFSDNRQKQLNKSTLLLRRFILKEPVTLDCNYNNLLENIKYINLPYYEVKITTLLTNSDDNRNFYIIEDKENCELLQNITKPNIKICKYEVNFEEECKGKYKIIYLFKVKNNTLHLTKIFNEEFYISRDILYKRSARPSFWKSINENSDLCYFYGNEAAYKALLTNIDLDQQEYFKFYSTKEEANENIKKLVINTTEQNTVHVFNIHSKKDIEWSNTIGNIQRLREYIHPERVKALAETEIIDQKILILAGEPGMGKSITVGHLYSLLKATHWVFAVSLRNCNCDYINEPNSINFDSAAKFVLKNSNNSDADCIQYLLSYCLENQSKLNVYLLFDGYDEIHKKQNRTSIISLVKFLKLKSTAQILITTRKYRSEELENRLAVFACSYGVVSNYETKILGFCSIFWRLLKDTVDVKEIKLHIKKMLQSVTERSDNTITNFVGIPLQIRMITEILASQDPRQILDTTLEDTLSFYEKYIEIHYYKYFKINRISNNKVIEELIMKGFFEELYKIAIMKLFKLNCNYSEHNYIEELNKVGLIQSRNYFDNINFEFLHDSIRDLFIAQLLKMWLGGPFIAIHPGWNLEEFIISDFLTNGNNKEMRFFLNCYLKRKQVSKYALGICRDKLLQLLQERPNLLLNMNDQETVFHMCVTDNVCYLLKYFLFNIIEEKKKIEFLSKRNTKLETPLFLAVSKLENVSLQDTDRQNALWIFIEEVYNYKVSDVQNIFCETLYISKTKRIDLERIGIYSNEYFAQILNSDKFQDINEVINLVIANHKYIEEFLNACRTGDIIEVSRIFNNFGNGRAIRKYLLSSADETEKTCLHLTTNKDTMKKLLDIGCGITEKHWFNQWLNAKDFRGMTPLSRAIKNGQTEIAIMLIKQGAKNIPDNYGYTSFLRAAKCGEIQVLKELISKGVNLSERNRFGLTALMLAARYGQKLVIRYLLNIDSKLIREVNKRGMTPVHHAVQGNKTEVIKELREIEPNLINVGNSNGIVPLEYSIMRKQLVMTNCLLDNGADITKHLYLLKMLIEMRQGGIIKKILKEKKIKESDIEKVVADLTPEEKDYFSVIQKNI